MTSDYVALLDHLRKIGKVTLVGWSDGGIIGIDMAMKYPDKLTRVIAAGGKCHDRRREA